MNVKKIDSGRSEIYLHTSDRTTFKRCRRKWFLTSPFGLHLKPNLEQLGTSPYLWFGSGIHFALEDYHGYNKFENPVTAFQAYIHAHKPQELPVESEELITLGIEMLSYYQDWEKDHCNWETVWQDGKPLVEVNFALELEELTYFIHEDDPYTRWVRNPGAKNFKNNTNKLVRTEKWLLEKDWEKKTVAYGGTFDRIVEDEHGDWWILDYKTAAQFDTKKLPLDQQISAYCWAAEQWFEREIKGMLYVQMHKKPPKLPKETTHGISSDKKQRTTYKLYRQALQNRYGDFYTVPQPNLDTLAVLQEKETENGNDFIRFDWVERNNAHKESTYHHIIHEGLEMINPDTNIYPNPNMDCHWDCKFRDLCLAKEEDADVDFYLEMLVPREEAIANEEEPWRIEMYRQHYELFTKESEKYLFKDVESIDDFTNKYNEGVQLCQRN